MECGVFSCYLCCLILARCLRYDDIGSQEWIMRDWDC